MNTSNKKPEVYIHTGMGRTGTTFLQYKVFPKLGGIFYRRQVKFRRAVNIIRKGSHQKYLISGEMEYKKLERHMKEFSVYFPEAKPIIILRRHDEWIASQHRRFVKSGYALSFEAFYDLENDAGFWEKEWLRFLGNIETLEKYFISKPLVLFYDDLKNNPNDFILKLTKYLGATVDLSGIDLKPKHASYNEKQLRAIYTIGKKISLRKHKPSKLKIFNILLNLFRNTLRYATLYFARLIPDSWLSKDIFLPDTHQLKNVRNTYSPDWELCRKYAETNNPNFLK